MRPDVPAVAAEGLVAGVARQRDRHVPAGHLAQVAGRHRRRVGERLAVMAHDAGQQPDHVRLDHQLVVVGPVALGDEARVGQLVVGPPPVGEADREGLHPRAARPRHARDDDRRIDAARQKRAEGDVRHEADPHRLLDRRAHPLGCFALGQTAEGGREAGAVIAAHDRPPAAPDLERVSGGQLLEPLVDRVGAGTYCSAR